jgi:hypothetical protein
MRTDHESRHGVIQPFPIVGIAFGISEGRFFVMGGQAGILGASVGVGESEASACDREGWGQAYGASYWVGGWAESGLSDDTTGGGVQAGWKAGVAGGPTYTYVLGC